MKAYTCIGGPLSGYKVTSGEFRGPRRVWDSITQSYGALPPRPAGRYHCFEKEYVAYNRGSLGNSRDCPSMVWLYRELLLRRDSA